MSSVKLKHTLIVLLVLSIAIFLAKFPTIYHSLKQNEDIWFVGYAVWFDQKDISSYIAHIRTAENDGIFIRNRYTLVDHPGTFIFQPYTVLGVINRYLHLDYFLLFHISNYIIPDGC